jgi:hypothetical protein
MVRRSGIRRELNEGERVHTRHAQEPRELECHKLGQETTYCLRMCQKRHYPRIT